MRGKARRTLLQCLCTIADLRPLAHVLLYRPLHAITIERLHDRDRSAWWLIVSYLVPGLLSQLTKTAWFAGAAGIALYYVLALTAFALTIWGFVEIVCLRGTAGSNTYGPDP